MAEFVITAALLGACLAFAFWMLIYRLMPRRALAWLYERQFGRFVLDATMFVGTTSFMIYIAGPSALAMATGAMAGVIATVMINIHGWIVTRGTGKTVTQRTDEALYTWHKEHRARWEAREAAEAEGRNYGPTASSPGSKSASRAGRGDEGQRRDREMGQNQEGSDPDPHPAYST